MTLLYALYQLYWEFVKVPEKVSGTFIRDVADFHCDVAVSHWARDKVMHIISIIRIIYIMHIICYYITYII